MSRQQIRSSGDGAIDPSLVQKKRARHRLVGAVCLCLIAAVIVPMVLESEPRPRDRDVPIELAAPDRNADERSAGAPAASGPPVASGPTAAAADAAGAQSAVKTVVPPGPAAGASSTTVRPDAKPSGESSKADVVRADAARADAAKADSAKQHAAKQELARQESAKATTRPEPSKPSPGPDNPAGRSEEPDVLARLIDRTDSGSSGAAAGAVSRRFLVQIGAYSNVQSARTVSDRVVQVGLRPYQETVKTAQGDWIRVRVGPFSTRQDAERAQQDLKRVGVTAAIIAL